MFFSCSTPKKYIGSNLIYTWGTTSVPDLLLFITKHKTQNTKHQSHPNSLAFLNIGLIE